jgi:SAM-dependent methyltransferase
MGGWKRPLSYDILPREPFHRLAGSLREIGYCPERAAECLALGGTDELYPLDYRYLPRWDDLLSQRPDDLSPVVRLLLLGLPVETARIEGSLGSEQTGFLIGTGLAFESGGMLRPRLSIVPFEDLLVATDRLFMNADPESAEEGLSSDNCVWRLDRTTLLMSQKMRKDVAGEVLELGCGSGVLSLLTAKACPEHGRMSAKHVTGVDINTRAVNVAGFNARLNGVENAGFIQGDLYRPVKGKRFDYIFSNPPSAPGLVRGWNREGGATGREMVEEMLRGLDGHLKPGGVFQASAHFGYRGKGDIGSWAGNLAGSGRHEITYDLLGEEEDAGTFALREAWQKAGPRDYGLYLRTYRQYSENLGKAGMDRLCFGILTFEGR